MKKNGLHHLLVSISVGTILIGGVGFLRGGESAAGGKQYTEEELRNLDVTPKNCITSECHIDLKQFRFRHGPTAQGECAPCHQSVGGKHVFQAPAEGNDLCLECHDPVPLGKIEHEPVRENCLDCHTIHGANNRFFLIRDDPSAVCNECHADVDKDVEYVHGPFMQGLCLACHEPHESDNDNLLIAPPGEFCTICHEDIELDAENALVVHEPFVENCGDCHSGHGSNLRYFLLNSQDKLCAECHAEDVEAARNAKYTHDPVIEDRQCSECHTAHFSNFEKLLIQASGPLCLSCHNQTYEQPRGKQLDNIEESIAQSQFLHGPVRDDTCIPCHNAHGSEYVNLLNRYFPPRFYAPFDVDNYELCFFCHDQKVVLEEESRDTAFRNGLHNMHYLHVNREKGRTCRACHAEHASNNPVHIRDAVPYGSWMMEIDFERTDTGGSCATGCHARYAYDRENPVQNNVPGEE